MEIIEQGCAHRVKQRADLADEGATDEHKTYLTLASSGVRHVGQVQGDPKRAGEILPWVRPIISNLKAWLLGTFRGVNYRHLPRYLLEFTYRLNRRGIADRLFF